MLGMTTPIVTELPLHLEPTTADSFVEQVAGAAAPPFAAPDHIAFPVRRLIVD
jgi:hypothetical protein